MDSYKTIKSESRGEFKDRGSKFIAYAYPVYTAEDWQARLEEIRKTHPKARHHCYAYRLGLDNNNFRANDDGEPSGTAGRPILGQIDHFQLTNIIVIVVRYFGGTLLGTSGLINAYKNSSAAALRQAQTVNKTVEDIFKLRFDYALMSDIMNAVKKLGLEIVSKDFDNSAQLEIAVRKSKVTQTLKQIKANAAKVRIEEADELKSIEGLEITYLYTR